MGDVVSYSISSQPDSDISIDETTGKITWVGSLDGLIPNPNYVLNVQITASDGKDSITHEYTIMVMPNPSPTSTILDPGDGTRVTSEGILLEWEGEDDGEEPLKYDIYLGTSETSVLMMDTGEDDGEETLKYDIYLGISRTDVAMLHSSVRWMEDVEGNSIHTGEVEPGKTYYWKVIPKDIYSSGTCNNDVFSFSVNIPPTIIGYTVSEVKIGVEFRLTLMGSDLNNDDLEFSLVEGPAGMEIFEGMITWIPAESQVGPHMVNISLSDGYETIYEEFEVEVADKEIIDDTDEKGSPIVLIIVIILIILILAGAAVGIFLYMKKKGEEELKEEPPEEKPPKDTGPSEEEKKAYDQLYG